MRLSLNTAYHILFKMQESEREKQEAKYRMKKRVKETE